jgi:Leucine-rich repeat (LRR) protein
MKRTNLLVLLLCFLSFSSLIFTSCKGKDKGGDGTTTTTGGGSTTVEVPRPADLLSDKDLYAAKEFKTLEEALKEPNDKVYRLNLTSKDLSAGFPMDVFKLTKLQSLRLNGCKLKSLPAELGTLSNLQILEIGGNPDIKELPKEISKLTQLHKLGMSGIKAALPAEFSALKSMKNLEMVSCEVTEFPKVVLDMPNMEDLNLNSNKMTSVPAEISKLKNLKSLGLMFNALPSIPASISELPNLERLLLHSNKLTVLPAELSKLSKLRDLYAPQNLLTALPESFSGFAALSSLDISTNPSMNYGQACTIASKIKTLQYFTIASQQGSFSKTPVTLPAEINLMTQIMSLDVSGNVFADANAEIGKFKNLTQLTNLNLMGCGLKSLSSDIGVFTKLKTLNLDWNPDLKALPKEIANIKELSMLMTDKAFPASERGNVEKWLPKTRHSWQR